jgi:cytochrome oxidase Cu insertion factor (SCO1/SenC/PrrC family)
VKVIMRIKLTNVLLAAAVLLVLAALPDQLTFAQAQRPSAQGQRAAVYSCPMHAEVKAKRPGKCPKCGMALRLVKDDATPAALANTSAAPTPAPPAGPAEIDAEHALHIPDTTVYDQNGRKLNFYSDLVQGKTVAINFIFTTCTTICPPLTATFRKVQQELGARVGRDVSLISVSVDPTTDVPARLRDFSAKFNAAPGWTFVTGSKPEIDQLLNALGAAVANKNEHTPMILIGNATANYWTRAYGLAPAATLVKAINEAAGQRPNPQPAAETKKTAAPSAAPTRPGASYFTNLVLLTQDNRPVHFYDDLMKDKVVLINFVFTTCKGACSPMTANLAKVQQYLGAHLGKEIVMLSVSVDPTTDTPAALKKYADLFKAQPGWYFLTGKKENVDWVLYKLGGYVEDKNQHGLALIIGNEATGDWVKMHAMAKPSDIADAALKLLAAK